MCNAREYNLYDKFWRATSSSSAAGRGAVELIITSSVIIAVLLLVQHKHRHGSENRKGMRDPPLSAGKRKGRHSWRYKW